MKISHLDPQPIDTFPYRNIGSRSECNPDGSRKILTRHLPVFTGQLAGGLHGLDALIVASDLQGNIEQEDRLLLLGEPLAGYLAQLAEQKLGLSPQNIGVVLAGDLYATLDQRGGWGDVRQVYARFRERFKWVAGVYGNHDKIGESLADERAFRQEKNIFILHKQQKQIDGLAIAGISGVIGNATAPNQVEEGKYLHALRQLLQPQPDLLLLHESPDYPAESLLGNAKIREVIETAPPSLVICGHRYWPTPLRTLANGTQILNVHERVVIFTA